MALTFCQTKSRRDTGYGYEWGCILVLLQLSVKCQRSLAASFCMITRIAASWIRLDLTDDFHLMLGLNNRVENFKFLKTVQKPPFFECSHIIFKLFLKLVHLWFSLYKRLAKPNIFVGCQIIWNLFFECFLSERVVWPLQDLGHRSRSNL